MFLLVFISARLQAQSQNLPLDHWAYSFLDRLQTKGLFISEDFDTRPYSREAIAEIILQIYQTVQNHETSLSKVEWQLFEQLKGEFHDELRASGESISIHENEYEPHLLNWKNEDLVVYFDGLLGQQSKFESKQDVNPGIPKFITSVGLGARVDIKKSMAIFVDARSFVLSDTDSLSNTVFNPSLGPPVTKNALVGITVTDNVSSYLVYRLPWFDLQIGRDLVEWGPGYRGNLALSRNANFYDMFKMTFRYNKVKFEYFHAFLNSDVTKYLVGHRLEIRPSRHFQFAIHETVVYGERDVEFLYFNPFSPIIISERHLGNQDNNSVGADFTFFLPRQNLKLYSEIFFDDFSFAKHLINNFVNKWAVIIGGYWVDPFGINNSDFRFEFIHIQPRVYSHVNPVNTYSNYNNIIGHWLGPDADDWYFEFVKQFHKNVRVGLSWEQRRRGVNDINFGERPENDIFYFLDGVVERNRFYGLFGRWQIRRDLFFNLTYHYIQTKNLQKKPGLNQNNHRLFLNLSLNY